MTREDPIVIVSAVRTPMGGFLGDFKDVNAATLGAAAVRAGIENRVFLVTGGSSGLGVDVGQHHLATLLHQHLRGGGAEAGAAAGNQEHSIFDTHVVFSC